MPKQRQRRVRHSSKGITLQELWHKYNGICQGCGNSISIEESTRDHIKSRRRGGSNKRKNIQLMCRPCNQLKRHISD